MITEASGARLERRLDAQPVGEFVATRPGEGETVERPAADEAGSAPEGPHAEATSGEPDTWDVDVADAAWTEEGSPPAQGNGNAPHGEASSANGRRGRHVPRPRNLPAARQPAPPLELVPGVDARTIAVTVLIVGAIVFLLVVAGVFRLL